MIGAPMRAAIPSRPADTSAEAEHFQINLLRSTPVSRRLHLAWSLSATVIGVARGTLARKNPHLSQQELDLIFVELHYGAPLTAQLRHHLARPPHEGPNGS